jgi:DNA-binding response OmpR family regulator
VRSRHSFAAKDIYERPRDVASFDCMSTALVIAEPETATRGFLERHLADDGFEVVAGDDLPRLLEGDPPDVVLLGLDKPFDYEELLERIREAFARAGRPRADEVVEAGPLRIDTRTRTVRVGDTRVWLSLKEFALLLELAREPERVFTKDELLRAVWGYKVECRTRTLDSHASRLRRKLRAADAETELVVNVWGIGYRLLDALEP